MDEVEIFGKPYAVKQLGKTFVLDPEVYVDRKGKPININVQRKLIDKKNKQVGLFDLGNHVLIAGMILLVIFVSMNVD